MTQFEFISVAASIVLAMSAARMLAALPHVLAAGRRYWVHALWSMILLLMHLGFWWAIWSYREVDPWTFRGFVAVMLTPAFLYLAVNALVSDNPVSVESWRTHFYARHRAILSLVIATALSIPLRQFAVLGDASAPAIEGALAPPLPAVIGFFLMALAGVVSKTERVHAVLVVIFSAAFLFNFSQL
jgi:hypothetical protein